MDMNGNIIYAVDFDGTLSLGAKWPEVGAPNVPLIEYLKQKKAEGGRLILWTCRNGKDLEVAVDYCKKAGLEFDTVNENLPELIEAYGGDARKINADVYFDDKAVNPIPIMQAPAAAEAGTEAQQPTLQPGA